MEESFTLHCIPWQKGASLMMEARAVACRIGLLSLADALPDETDEMSSHAMVLDDSGKAIGCARIKTTGILERMAVLPRDDSARIEQALRLAAWLHSDAPSCCA
jgi:hypothetical protein